MSVIRMLDEKKNRNNSYITILLVNVQYVQKWPPSFSMHNLTRLWKRISIVYCYFDVKAMAVHNTGHLWSLISLDHSLEGTLTIKSIFCIGMYQFERMLPYLDTKNKFRLFLKRKIQLSLSTTWNNWRYGSFNSLNAELNPIRHLLAFLGAHHILHVSRIRVNSYHRYEKQWVASFTSEPI